MRQLGVKNIIQKRVCHVLPSILALSFILSGCGKAGKTDLSEDMNRVNDSVNSGSDAETADTSAEIPENISWEFASPSGNNKVLVDAPVISAGYDNAGVYSADRVAVDEDYLKRLADELFDGGIYEAVKPYGACSMEELEEEETYFLGLQAQAEADGYEANNIRYIEINYAMETYDEAAAQEWQEGEIIWKNNGYTEGRLRGEIGGMVYELAFSESKGNEEWPGTYTLQLVPLSHIPNIYGFSDLEYNLSATLYGENHYNMEEARRYASDLAERLGFSDMEIADVAGLVMSEDETLYMDGYRVFFVRNTGGIQNIVCSNSYTQIDNIDRGGCQEYLTMDINSQGIIGITFPLRYELMPMSEQTGKLTFEQVNIVACDYMQDIINSYDEVNGQYTEKVAEIRMGYMTLLYEDQYVLAPVWVYMHAHAFSDQPIESAWFGVNALDGSIIDMGYDSEIGTIESFMY